MNSKIRSWRARGIICDDWSKMYERYINATNCERCGAVFRKDVFKDGKLWRRNNKVLEHNHTTGRVRYVACQSCNIKLRYIDEEKELKEIYLFFELKE
jgi:hypothetical protein